MDDKYQLNKKPYLPPRLVSVAFKVEEAFASLRLLPNLDGGGPGLDSYNTAANSNSFWDSEVTSGGQTDPYDTRFRWNW